MIMYQHLQNNLHELHVITYFQNGLNQNNLHELHVITYFSKWSECKLFEIQIVKKTTYKKPLENPLTSPDFFQNCHILVEEIK